MTTADLHDAAQPFAKIGEDLRDHVKRGLLKPDESIQCSLRIRDLIRIADALTAARLPQRSQA